MYEAVVVDNWPMLQYEVEYFWRHRDRRWATASLYDPALDSQTPLDPVRYTVLAAIVEELVASFEWRLELGLRRKDPGLTLDQDYMPLVPESKPDWPSRVPALPEMLYLQPVNDDEEVTNLALADGNAFTRRNVFVWIGEFYTV
jgi:hypothetical protein